MSSGTERVERKLAAIFCADVADYSRLMHADEVQTLRTLTAHRAIMDGLIAQHGGRIANTAGDSVLAEFPSVVDAVECAVAVQEKLGEANAGVAEDRALRFRIGVHVGDVMVRGGDLLGDGVNVAARVQALADPGGLSISGRAHDEIEGKLSFRFEDQGEQQVKNIARPVRVYALAARARTASEPQPKALPLPDKPSIAVLPFTSMSGDPEQEYFADGIVEDIITSLSRFKWLFVIARNSSFTYKGRAVDVKQVGRELGVRYVLEGSIRKAGQRVRITGQLIDVATGSHLWAEKFDGALDDIFQLQDEVSASVANAVAPKLEQVETERAKRKTFSNLGAYDYLLRARAVYKGNSWRPAGGLADVEEAHRLLLKALELDPEFGPAHAAAAHTFSVLKANRWTTDTKHEVAETDRFARAAGRFAADDPAALCIAGSALAHVVHDPDAGTSYTDRALALAPGLATANLYGALVANWRGDTDLAIARLTRAMRLSPLDPMLFAMQDTMAQAHLQAGRYHEAASWAEASVADQPNDSIATRILAASYALAGDTDRAKRARDRLMHLLPTLRLSNLGEMLGPYRPEALAQHEEALRLAGVPE